MVIFKKTSESNLKSLQVKDKPYRYSIGRGLNLLVKPNGTKYFIYRYRFGGKENNLSLGRFPETSLLEAENEVVSISQKLKKGIDPSYERKQERQLIKGHGNFKFEVIASEMVNFHFKHLTDNYRTHSLRRFEKHIFPWLGERDIRDIKAKDVMNRLNTIEEQNLGDTIKKVRILINLTFKYAILTDRSVNNPCDSLKGLIKAPKSNHMPSFTDEEQVAGLMRSIDCFKGSVVVSSALKLAPLVFVRPGELRTAKWQDINFESCEWRFTVSKTNTEHLVPLSQQAIKILDAIKKITGELQYVFPNGNDKNKPMSEAAINASLRRLGYDTKTEFTGHGFRAMARTLLHEKLDYDPHVIEHQLAHSVPDSLGQAYNRTKFIDKRKTMMQDWSDYLYKLKEQ